jgi:hypothetical protein
MAFGVSSLLAESKSMPVHFQLKSELTPNVRDTECPRPASDKDEGSRQGDFGAQLHGV